MGSQVEIAKRHVGATSHDNVINTSPLSIGPTSSNSQPRGFRENSNGASSSRQPTKINAPTFLCDLNGSPSITDMNIRNPIVITIIDTSQIGRNEDRESFHTRLGEIRQRSMHISNIHDGENDEQPPPRVPSIAEMRNDIEAQRLRYV
ncbi:hypothetical protein SESBI_42081 [Sesbania bispinosa]|nr:hypothetical protein SESBI_42081 [Sesbania bispinosa]